MSERKGLHIAVGIENPDISSGQSDTLFEATSADGRLAIPISNLIRAFHNSSDEWSKQTLQIQAFDVGSDDDVSNNLFAADNRIEMDRKLRSVTIDENKIDDLPNREFSLLEFLLSNLDSVQQRADIYQSVWGHPFKPNERSVDVYIAKLRKKLDNASYDLGDRKQGAIRSYQGIGYFAVSSLDVK